MPDAVDGAERLQDRSHERLGKSGGAVASQAVKGRQSFRQGDTYALGPLGARSAAGFRLAPTQRGGHTNSARPERQPAERIVGDGCRREARGGKIALAGRWGGGWWQIGVGKAPAARPERG